MEIGALPYGDAPTRFRAPEGYGEPKSPSDLDESVFPGRRTRTVR